MSSGTRFLPHKPAWAFLFSSLSLLAVYFLLSHDLNFVQRHSVLLNEALRHPNQQERCPVEQENGVIVSLVRNEELSGILDSIQSLEDRFNKRFRYPYVFLNDKPFESHFKDSVNALISSTASYGFIEPEDWEEPSWIDKEKAEQERENADYLYGHSQSYRRMCRYQSGGFYRHPLMQSYDFYWRLEPSVRFFCDIQEDPFLHMSQHNKSYGWTVARDERPKTIPTLWDTTKEFIKKNPQFVADNNGMGFVSDDEGETYNLCHFWSNFEIGSLSFLRGEAYQAYFDALDRAGGFFYERWGDAPIHSIAAALLLDKSQLSFFDLGYQHDEWRDCPANAIERKCEELRHEV